MKKISIITVTYNCKEDLRQTFESLHSQTFQDYEHIIIDGGSTDGTIELINENESKVDQWVSEKDKGIYDAMNKGIDMARGEYVQFLNAGDIFFDEHSLTLAAKEMYSSKYDIIFGEIILTDKQGNKVYHVKPLGFDLETLKNRGTASVNHQSFFAKKDLIPMYSSKYKLKGELDWYINIAKKNRNLKTHYLQFPLIRYKLGGAGNIHYLRNLKEWILIINKHFGFFQNIKNISRYKRFLEYNKRIRKYVF